MKIRCPACSQTLSATPQMQGMLVDCPCGSRLRVPAPATMQAPAEPGVVAKPVGSGAIAPASVATVVSCQCGKSLRVPVSAFGKAVRCPCGSLTSISPTGEANPTATSDLSQATREASSATGNFQSQPEVVDNSWLSDLPPAATSPEHYAQASPYATSPYANSPAAAPQEPPSVHTGNSAEPENTNRGMANHLLAAAERERLTEDSSNSSLGDGSVATGLLAMVGAVVWFAVGWWLGYIFFYPPVLFVLGMMGVIRGLLR